MIIDSTYFRNKLVLPQAGNPEGLILVNNFINQYEKEYLRCALGYSLWEALNAAVEDSSPEERWEWLLNGHTYINHGHTHNWVGFSNAEKVSPIANYVYFQFLDNKASDTVLTGTVVSETDNNSTVNAVDKMIDAWNRMVDMNWHLQRYLKANKSLYLEWRQCECSRSRYWDWPTYHYSGCHYYECANNVFKKKNSFDL